MATEQSTNWLLETDQFFEDDNENANLDIWAIVPFWTVQEATSLSYGFDPVFVEEKYLPQIGSVFVREFRERATLVEKALAAKILKSPLTPLAYVRWAKTVGLHVNTDVTAAVEEHNNQKNSISAEDEEKPLNAKLRKSYLTIILGMAVSKYQFRQGNNPATTLIQNDLIKLGLELDADNIRDKLQEASSLLFSRIEEHRAQLK